jgi:hypothetical protein
MEHQWNKTDRGKPKYSRKNLSRCQFVHHKSHMDSPGFFFCLSGFFFPLIHFFVLFKSFRPSCHFAFHTIVLTTNTTQTFMPPVGFEPTIPVSERPQTHALDRTVTGIGRGSNPGLRGERPATNRLSHGTALYTHVSIVLLLSV